MLHEKMIGKSISSGLTFDKSPTKAKLWADLIETGTISDEMLNNLPESWAVSEKWQTVLNKSVAEHGTTWLHELLLGVIALNQEQFQSAREHFKQSLRYQDNVLAHRHLALIAQHNGDYDEAKRRYLIAWDCSEELVPLAVEICRFFQTENALGDLAAFLALLPDAVAQQERIRLAQGQLCLETGAFDKLREILDGDFFTIREGETVLTDLWSALHVQEVQMHLGRSLTGEERREIMIDKPVPDKIDFRMVNL